MVPAARIAAQRQGQAPRFSGESLTYHPSLLGAYLMVLSFAYAQRDRHGTLTPQMWCFAGFGFAYLFTHYVKEENLLSMWDVLDENFGLMLVWGDLSRAVLLSLPGFWIVDEPRHSAPRPGSTDGVLLIALASSGNELAEGCTSNATAGDIWGRPATIGALLVSGWWGIGAS
jgi:hypothetical protein